MLQQQKKLTKFNILLLILIPLFVCVAFASVMYAAMTASNVGRNVITIDNLGTIESSITFNTGNTPLCPGITSNIDATFTYTPGTSSIRTVTIDTNTFEVTKVVLRYPNSTIVTLDSTSAISTVFPTIVLNKPNNNNIITVPNGLPSAELVFSLAITPTAPTDDLAHITPTTDTFLLNSVQSVTIDFSIRVSG